MKSLSKSLGSSSFWTTQSAAIAVALIGMTASSACSYHARDAEAYRQATRDALMTQNDEVEACYDQALAGDASAGGQVVVHFEVEKKTGKVVDPRLDQQGTTASPTLAQCVLNTLDGVALAEPDRREGQATFTWSFAPRAGEAAADEAPPAPPMAPVAPPPVASPDPTGGPQGGNK